MGDNGDRQLRHENEQLKQALAALETENYAAYLNGVEIGARLTRNVYFDYVLPLYEQIGRMNNVASQIVGMAIAGRGKTARRLIGRNLAYLSNAIGQTERLIKAASRELEIDVQSRISHHNLIYEIYAAAVKYCTGEDSGEALRELVADYHPAGVELIELRSASSSGRRPDYETVLVLGYLKRFAEAGENLSRLEQANSIRDALTRKRDNASLTETERNVLTRLEGNTPDEQKARWMTEVWRKYGGR